MRLTAYLALAIYDQGVVDMIFMVVLRIRAGITKITPCSHQN